jgi:hypothetical protein
MGHFARVINGIVDTVIVADQEDIDSGRHGDISQWIQTSYNTRGGVHYTPGTNQPSDNQAKAIRKNYAGPGMTYDVQRDAFIPVKPYPSWILNEQSCTWDPPVQLPANDGQPHPKGGAIGYNWDEENQQWVLNCLPLED